MDASTLPKGQSSERTEGRPLNEPGIYQHKDTKGKFITAEGEAGVLQADALMSPVWKDAWERIGDVPNRLELLKMRKKQLLEDTAEEAAQKEADEAELAAVVGKPAKAETDDPAPGTGVNFTPVTV